MRIIFLSIASVLVVFLICIGFGAYLFPKAYPTLVEDDGTISFFNVCVTGILFCLFMILVLLTIGTIFSHITIKPFNP